MSCLKEISPHFLLKELLSSPFHPKHFFLNEKKLPLMQFQIPIASLDLLHWLETQLFFPKFYWEDLSGQKKIAAIGVAYYEEEIPQFSEGDEIFPRFFGGKDFAPREKGGWEGFPSSYFFLPKIEIEEKAGQTLLTFNRTSSLEETSWVERLTFSEKEFALPLHLPLIKARNDHPSFSQWKRQVEKGLQKIERGELQKIVFARKTKLLFEKNLSIYSILSHLQRRKVQETLFTFKPSKGKCFLGLTPEQLYKREERKITTMALAGTKVGERDPTFLLKDQKSFGEFEIVRKWMEEKLFFLCKEVISSPFPKLLETKSLQHLFQSFEGTLKETISDTDLIATLHPTPALGGMPQKEALEEIDRSEPFDRGWYGAPIGWISKKNAHFIVGIRSALIENNSLTSFTGVGIVKGSTPEGEWEELEGKMANYLWNNHEQENC
ncbi:MAG: isochorismate synthase [Simkania negevensis]|nr:isochorismate synthase [Simkania negevensis]